MSGPAAATRGRPRDPQIDAVVLDTTRRLLAEAGFAATTVQEISRRSGVHPPAIYRRWPSRLALVEDAAFSGLAEITVEPTGDLRADLERFVEAYHGSLATPAARAAIPGLAASYHDQPPVGAEWLHLSVRPQFYAILAAAPDQVDDELDVDAVFDVIEGVVLARILVPLVAARATPIADIVEMLLRILTPPSGAASRSGRR